MTQPNAVPLGSRFQVGWGFESAFGLKTATMYFIRASSIEFLPDRQTLAAENMEPSGRKLASVQGFVRFPFKITLAPDVNSIVRMIAHIRGHASIVTASSVSTWTIRDFLRGVDSALASELGSIFVEFDKDDGAATLLMGAVITGYKLTVDAGKLLKIELKGLASAYTNHGDAAIVAGTTVGPLIRGNLKADLLGASGLLKVKATTAGNNDGAGAKYEFTRGVTAYGGNSFFGTRYTWQDAIDGTVDLSTVSGDIREKLQIAPFAVDADLNDEWSYAILRIKAAASYSTRNPLVATAAEFKIATAKTACRKYEIECDVNYEVSPDTSQATPSGIYRSGGETWRITVERDYIDRSLVARQHSFAVFAAESNIYGDNITTIQPELWKHAWPQCKMLKAGADPKGAGIFLEPYIIEASYDGTNAVCTETIKCSVTTLV